MVISAFPVRHTIAKNHERNPETWALSQNATLWSKNRNVPKSTRYENEINTAVAITNPKNPFCPNFRVNPSPRMRP